MSDPAISEKETVIARRFGSVCCGFHHDSIVVDFVEHAAPCGRLWVCDVATGRVLHQDEGLPDEVVHPGPLLAVGTVSGELKSSENDDAILR